MPTYKFDTFTIENAPATLDRTAITKTYQELVNMNSKHTMKIVDGCYDDLKKIAKEYVSASKTQILENALAYYAFITVEKENIKFVTDANWIMNRAVENLNNINNLKRFGIGVMPSRILWLANNGYSFKANPAENGETHFIASPSQSTKTTNPVFDCSNLFDPASYPTAVEELQEKFSKVVLGKKHEYKNSSIYFPHRGAVYRRLPLPLAAPTQRTPQKSLTKADNLQSSATEDAKTKTVAPKVRRSFMKAPTRPSTLFAQPKSIEIIDNQRSSTATSYYSTIPKKNN